jgi:hypothetical protein
MYLIGALRSRRTLFKQLKFTIRFRNVSACAEESFEKETWFCRVGEFDAVVLDADVAG